MNTNLFVSIRALFVLLFALGFPASAKEIGGSAGDIWAFGASARYLGMGNAAISLADDATASYFNPARLDSVRQKTFTALNAPLLVGANFNYFGLVYPTFSRGVWGLFLVRVGADETLQRDENNTIIGSYNFSELGTAVSYAKPLNHEFAFGATVKRLTRGIAGFSSALTSIDLGADYRITARASAAIVTRNILSFAEGTKDRLEPNFVVGGNYEILIDKLKLALDLDQRGPSLRLGLEYRWGPLFGRFGWGDTARGGGLGIRFGAYQLDYALSAHDLGYSNYLSLSFWFGQDRFKEREILIKTYAKTAEMAYEKGRFLEAARFIDKAIELDPKNLLVHQRRERILTIIDSFGLTAEELQEPSFDADIKDQAKFVLMIKELASYISAEIDLNANAGVHLSRADGYFQAGRFALSARSCEEAIRLEPYSALGHEKLGTAYFAMGLIKKAKEAWARALELNPTNQNLRNFLRQIER